jgi:hypothetical protein
VSPVDGVVVRLIPHRTAGVGIVIDAAGYQYHLNNDVPGIDNVGDSGNAECSMSHVHIGIDRPDGRPTINPALVLAARPPRACRNLRSPVPER